MAKTAKGTGEDNRQKIIDAAMTLITEKGVEKPSLAQISKAAGLSKGTLYYYYANKNDLIFDITDIHMEKITKAILSMGLSENGSISFERMLTAYFEVLLASEARSRLHLYLIREAVFGNNSLKKRFQTTYAQWFGLIDNTWMNILGQDDDIHSKSRFLVAVVEGFILQALLEVEKTSIQDIVRLVSRLVKK